MTKQLSNWYKNKRKPYSIIALSFTLLFLFFSAEMVFGQQHYNPKSGSAAYWAKIRPLNSNLTQEDVSGFATFIVKDGQGSVYTEF